jgi:hypothetical protein
MRPRWPSWRPRAHRYHPAIGRFCSLRRTRSRCVSRSARAAAEVQAGVLGDSEDIFDLTVPELHDVVRTHQVDESLIRQRADAFRSYQALTPPQVLTSEGEAIAGSYHAAICRRARWSAWRSPPAPSRDGPASSGTWRRPISRRVGGLITHGAVIAREHGLPAVVGVQGATRLIRDGQPIRVHRGLRRTPVVVSPAEAVAHHGGSPVREPERPWLRARVATSENRTALFRR